MAKKRSPGEGWKEWIFWNVCWVGDHFIVDRVMCMLAA
jgi:hypothetical protein